MEGNKPLEVDQILPPRADQNPPHNMNDVSPPQDDGGAPRNIGTRSKRAKGFRWKPSFSLRLLLVCQLLLAIPLSMLTARLYSFRAQQAAVEKLAVPFPDRTTAACSFDSRAAEPEWFWSIIRRGVDVDTRDYRTGSVHYEPLTEANAKEIGKLRHLEVLYLYRGVENPHVLAEVAKLPRLSRLDLRDPYKNGLDDDRLLPIASSRSIKEILIDSVHVTDEGVAALAEMPSVEKLNIHYAKVSIVGLRPWIAQNRLKELWLPNRLDEQDCRELSQLTSLRVLHAYDISPGGIVELYGHPNLIRIEIGGTSFSKRSIEAIRGLPDRVRVIHHRGFPLRPPATKGMK